MLNLGGHVTNVHPPSLAGTITDSSGRPLMILLVAQADPVSDPDRTRWGLAGLRAEYWWDAAMMIEQLTRPGQADDYDQQRLAECWMTVVNAGGAVGFPFPPVGIAEVTGAVRQVVASLDPQTCVLFRATEGGAVLGWVLLQRTASPLVGHWGTVERLQTHPDARGRGVGRALLAELERYAREELRLVQLHLAARGGIGLEQYDQHLGWSEVGRWPRALRFAEHDDRDEVLMLRELRLDSA